MGRSEGATGGRLEVLPSAHRPFASRCERSRQRVGSREGDAGELTGFSRYYEGIDGAALGFATLYKYDDVEMAKNSYLVDVAEEMLGVDGEKLVEYVWRKYGGDGQ